MYYTNPLRRFVFRKDVLKRVKARWASYQRRLAKSEITDLVHLFGSEKPKIILDVGANVGFVTWEFVEAFKQAVIYAFEPDPAPRGVFESAHGDHPRIRIFPIAAADRQATLSFVQRRVSCNSSLLGRNSKMDRSAEPTIDVEADTLDHFCDKQAIAHIDLLKIDTEGADLLVLKGAQGLLSRGAIEVILVEVLFAPTYNGQATFDEIAGFLKAHCFTIFNIYIGHETPRGRASYGNVIFVGSRLQRSL